VALYKEVKYVCKVAEIMQCSTDTVSKCLKLYQIPVSHHLSGNANSPRKIQQYSLEGD